jgi:WD40 repeat protein
VFDARGTAVRALEARKYQPPEPGLPLRVVTSCCYPRAIEVFNARGPAVHPLETRIDATLKGLLAFTGPDGPRIVAGLEDGSVLIWDGDTFAQLPGLTPHVGPLGAMCLLTNPSGGAGLVTGGQDGEVKVWSPRFEVVRTLPGFGKPVTALASYTLLAPRLLVGYMADTQSAGVRVYHAETGEQLQAFVVHEPPPRAFGSGVDGGHRFFEVKDSEAAGGLDLGAGVRGGGGPARVRSVAHAPKRAKGVRSGGGHNAGRAVRGLW